MRHVALALAVLLGQQTAAPKPAFEVATIKRNTAVDPGFALGFQPGGRFRAVGMDVRTLIAIAYQPPRLLPSQIVGGPDWMHTDGYDITAKAGDNLAGGTPAQQNARRGELLQSLLEDRFKLKVHRETRQLPRLALVLARKDGALGSHMRRAPVDCIAEPTRCETRSVPGQLTSTNMTMGGLAIYLASNVIQNVVVDRTGLTGFFAIDLEWAPDRTLLPLNGDATPPQSDRPSIFAALQDQLGLKLETERGTVEVLVVDHVERPIED
jgi:bla regulator protein blaR1